jgi:signal transduction histidine kinase/CheY-like chemotaxis protein
MTKVGMMQRLGRSNLWKATPAIALSVAGLLLVAGITIAVVAAQSYQTQKAREVGVQGRILASIVSAALTFGDQKAAEEYIGALAANPEILNAAVYDSRGALFAGYARASDLPPPPNLPPQGTVMTGDRLTVVTPVMQGAAFIGAVYLQVVTEPLERRLMRFGIVALLIIMVAVVVGVLGIAHSALTRANADLARQSLALAEANSTLLKQIDEREKAEAALRQAQKMEAIGHLTGGVAHDFNNLLQIILSSLGMLRRRATRWNLSDEALPDFQSFVDSATEGANRAAGLTRQLLAFARRQPLEPTRIDVNKLVAGMSELLRRTLGEAVAVETVQAGGLWPIFADANQLESALVNLAVNARDAMAEGGKLTIETGNAFLDENYVRAVEDVEPGQYVMVAVSDTGSGMTKEVLASAFEPFFTTKDIGHGTGLGLSQVYGFVKQSGGHIKIYSELGEGTTVKLYLPRLVSQDSAADRDPAEQVLPKAAQSELILVVEDEEAVRGFTVEMLRDLGYGILEAATAQAALRLIDANPGLKLLFTDVGLPGGVNGRQLADEALKRRPDLKVLFTSGYTRNAIVHGGRLDAGVALIGKPFTYAALAEKIRQVLNSEADE